MCVCVCLSDTMMYHFKRSALRFKTQSTTNTKFIKILLHLLLQEFYIIFTASVIPKVVPAIIVIILFAKVNSTFKLISNIKSCTNMLNF